MTKRKTKVQYTHHLHIRIESGLMDGLEEHAKQAGQTLSNTARSCLDTGLKFQIIEKLADENLNRLRDNA